MKKTYVWVYVADPESQFVSEIYGPCNEQTLSQINKELFSNPLLGLPNDTAEVLCSVRWIAAEPHPGAELNNVLYIPGYFDCSPVKPIKIRKIQKAVIHEF